MSSDGPLRTRLPIPITATLSSGLWSRKICPSPSGSRLINLYRDVSSAYQNVLFCCCCCFSHSALVANPKKLLYKVANPARGLLNREKRTKENIWQRIPPSSTLHAARSEKINKNHVTHLQALRRSRSVSRPYNDSFDSSTKSKGVASQNSTLPCAIATLPVSLLPSSLGDV